MTLQPILPVAVLAIVALALAAGCALGWRAARRASGGRAAGWDWARRSALAVIVVVMAAGPAVANDRVETYASGVEIYFVVDRTGSMAAEDWGDAATAGGADGGEGASSIETRLDGVRTDMEAIAKQNPGAQFSIISFDSVASQQLPLTTDARAVASWAATLTQEQTQYSTGSLIDRPLDSLTSALTDSYQNSPGNKRIVYFMSDGENTASGTPRSFAPLASMIDGGAVLGYGTEAGGKMRINDPAGNDSGYIQDPTQSGSTAAVSRIDESSLKSLAGEMNLDYVHRTADVAVTQQVPAIEAGADASATSRTVRAYQPLLWPFALAAAGLLVWEIVISTRRAARRVGVVSHE
ncbi:VWA domain-containing protein [Rarobacter incanus]|uniref:Ca-activated chloride channel family protein n=1 Tax=Rarobacter incanus TaxID=153494 RepID=A0A542SQ89_9MICO|nr:vWA domain-containing protein [Rarobacter incanus]TQK76776.1 Ca-activated chloride channel family protein [Rarobacter incanus]